jgi:anti-anti-sigma factor
MIKDYEIIRDGPVLTIVLGEELTTGNAPALMEEVAGYKEQGVEKVVFDATRLRHLSSSGVRVIIFCKQKLGKSPELVFVNCDNGVLDVLDIVGLRPFITFVER